jgi:hypothetical protein
MAILLSLLAATTAFYALSDSLISFDKKSVGADLGAPNNLIIVVLNKRVNEGKPVFLS